MRAIPPLPVSYPPMPCFTGCIWSAESPFGAAIWICYLDTRAEQEEEMLRIGIDVGGTNTDGVLMDGLSILAKHKARTTEDVMSGIVNAMTHLLDQYPVDPGELQAVMIGTTQFTNAVIERKELSPVGVIRLAAPATLSIRPATDWPQDLLERLPIHSCILSGGHEFDGHSLSELDLKGVAAHCKKMSDMGIRHVAMTGMFSPINDAHEKMVADFVHQNFKNLQVVTASKLGRLGILERENAAILNASLKPLAQKVISAFQAALQAKKLNCPLYLTQNDGTLMSAEEALSHPLLTLSSGPTNSMRGAAFLSGLKDAVVVDVGGTTTDVGILEGGLPRQSSVAINIGGVRTNFRMPDLHSIGLGGGTYIRVQEGDTRIGPDSCGHRIESLARVWGGVALTATDLAVAAQRVELGQAQLVQSLSSDWVRHCMAMMDGMMEMAVDRVRTNARAIPVLAVGGGSFLLPHRLNGLEVIRPPHHDVANAVGAAMAQISGEADQVLSLDTMNREQAIQSVIQLARKDAIDKGAMPNSLECHQVEDVPLAYMPGHVTRITVKVIGNLQEWSL